MTKFLYSYISLTTPIQIAPQTSLTESEHWHILNCKKFEVGLLWVTNDTPNHSKQRLQTRQTKLQTENKWRYDFSSFPHKQHKEFSTTIPRLSKLILIAILFSITLQTVNKAENKTLHLHNLFPVDYKRVMNKINNLYSWIFYCLLFYFCPYVNCTLILGKGNLW